MYSSQSASTPLQPDVELFWHIIHHLHVPFDNPKAMYSLKGLQGEQNMEHIAGT